MSASAEMKPAKRELRRWRFRLVNGLVLLAGVSLIARIAWLQVVPEAEQGFEFLQIQGESRTVRIQEVPSYRGMITDRNGEPLAISTPLSSLWVNPSVFDRTHLPKLAAALDLSTGELERRMGNYRTRQFMYLRRGMTPDTAATVLELDIPGVQEQIEFRRYYPEGEVVAQLVGLTDVDDRGIEGIELGYDQVLSGQPGKERVVKDLYGSVVKHMGVVKVVEPGADIQLSIDLRLQYLAYRALKAAVSEHQASAASMVIMDPRTGEVLAMVNQPSFNPNARDHLNPLAMRNRALVDSFEPGSTVKPFTLMAALEHGVVSSGTLIDTTPGYMYVHDKLIEDPVNYGELDVSTILSKSSQVGTVKIALSMDPESVHEMFQRVGLGSPPGLGFPGELGGILPQRSQWNDIQRATFAFGYGLTATSLQLAQAYSVIANGGSRVAPMLVQGSAAMPVEPVVATELIEQVRSMMEMAVEEGTGKRARIPGYRVAGKTGTGHLVGANGYDQSRYASLFAGMVPANDPQLVAVVVITDPSAGNYFGGLVAAPVFSEVMQDALRLLKISPGLDPQVDSAIAVLDRDGIQTGLAGGETL